MFAPDAPIPEVDAFMAELGVTLTHLVDRESGVHKRDIQNYYLPHADPTMRYPEIRGRGLHLGNYWGPMPGTLPMAHPTKQPWSVSAKKGLYTNREQRLLREDKDEVFRLLDDVATRIVDLGYPRTSATLTAYLFGVHTDQQRGWGNPRVRDPQDLAHCARLANHATLENKHKHDAAWHGFNLPELFAYLDAGIPYTLARDLLGAKEPDLMYAKS